MATHSCITRYTLSESECLAQNIAILNHDGLYNYQYNTYI